MNYVSRKKIVAAILDELTIARVLRAMARLRHGDEIEPLRNQNCNNGFYLNAEFHQIEYYYNDRAGSTHLVSMPVCGSGVNG